ncbi:MAG TPA: ribonuclease R, partial [Thermoanaerobaculia bacterium]|nr:ribonuclease R [Thermoanaerobaculia bacterium]
MSNGGVRSLPGTEATGSEKALALLDEGGREGLLFADLAQGWRLGREGGDGTMDGPLTAEAAEDTEELRSALAALAASGRAFEAEGRWVSVRQSGYRSGVIERLESGDALLKTPRASVAAGAAGGGRDGEASFFVPRRHLKGALDGDTVLVRVLAHKRTGGGRRLPEVAVVRVLATRYTTLVGTVEVDPEGYRTLGPFDSRVPLELDLMGADELAAGTFVVAQVERRGLRDREGRGARARVLEVLGDPEEPGVDVKVVLRHHGIPDEFPEEVLSLARSLPTAPQAADLAGRLDLTGEVIVTIDGESSRDFDDAISISRLPVGGFRLGVHIADVAHYVREGEGLDAEAYRRGTSVYYPERAVPMLPERLSNGLCSLVPAAPRLTVSAFLDLSEAGEVRSRRFAETVIRSARRLTYTEVRRVLEEPRPEDAAEYGEVLPRLLLMRELMEILLAMRSARGSLDFDLPEGDVELDTDGTMVGVLPEERNIAHRIVEEFMIAANEAVAFELVSRDCPALFRVHDAPSPERLEELRDLLLPLGIELPDDLVDLHPEALKRVLEQAAGRPDEHFVSSVVLRTMQRAFYDPQCRGHYALASRYYTHFTSPIRRYPDLLVHRRLKALLAGRAEAEAAATDLVARLPAIASHTSATEKRAEQSERDLLQWKKVRFLADRVGERFAGRITGVQPFGLFVQLDTYYVDGLVPIRTLGDDYYLYEAESHRLIGERHGRVFKLADAVEVELLGADLRHR